MVVVGLFQYMIFNDEWKERHNCWTIYTTLFNLIFVTLKIQVLLVIAVDVDNEGTHGVVNVVHGPVRLFKGHGSSDCTLPHFFTGAMPGFLQPRLQLRTG